MCIIISPDYTRYFRRLHRTGCGGRRVRVPLIAMLSLAIMASPVTAALEGAASLLDMSIEELGQIEVTTVSRRVERQRNAPASVYVITREQIRSSGITSIPEALRLAPGVEVARNGASSWTISMRGFSSDLSNKLLVLIDGRSVYSPLFAGVYWDAHDTLLEDIDRIEVIAGPGGTLWGANAVNGVINIVTRSAWENPGGLLTLAVGNEVEFLGAARYTGRIGSDVAARAYVKRTDRDASRTLTGERAVDDWRMEQAGFRMDWAASATDAVTLQGDVYDADQSALLRGDFVLGTLPGPSAPGTVDVRGHNLMTRWDRKLGEGANLQLQAYYDHTYRDIPGTFRERRDTFDVELIHNLRPYGRHDLTWGATLRITEDDLRNSQFATFDPASRTDRRYSAFVQDRIDLKDDRWYLTLGTKVENNDYTGTEHQPNVRLSWLISDRQTLWAAISRAVRIPARLNQDLSLLFPVSVPDTNLPIYVNVRGSDEFRSEELLAYEVGYRATAADLSADLALFNHAYDYLQTNEFRGPPTVVPGPPAYTLLPIVQGNGMRGDVYGGTLNVWWRPMPEWRLELQLAHTRFDLELRPGSGDEGSLNVAGNSPKNQAAVQSYLQLGRTVSLYTGIRYVDDLPNQAVPSYVAVDLSVDWQLTPRARASLTIRDLTDRRHAEFGRGNELERSAIVRFDLTF
jgi:iron complex outermembrane recepter protein